MHNFNRTKLQSLKVARPTVLLMLADMHVTNVSPIPWGSEIQIKAKLVARKEEAKLLIMEAEVSSAGKVVATGRFIKSLTVSKPKYVLCLLVQDPFPKKELPQ